MINVYWYIFFSITVVSSFDLNFVWFFIFWYIVERFSICKLYSFIFFIFLSLEILPLVPATVVIIYYKLCITHRFLFSLFYCGGGDYSRIKAITIQLLSQVQ